MIYPDNLFVESSSYGFRVILDDNPISGWFGALNDAVNERDRLSLLLMKDADIRIFELVVKVI